MSLLIEDRGPARHIYLNRPERRNALSLELLRDLDEALQDAEGVRVVVLGGAGPAFSSGHDLKEMTSRSEAEYREIFETCTAVMERIHRMPAPVIARVHGIATAAGCQLVAACDLAIATPTATFATPGVRIGLFCHTPMVELSRCIGRKQAMEMLLTGESIDAETALRYGLINRVVAAESLDEAIDKLSNQITQFSRDVIAEGKRAFYDQVESPRLLAYRAMTDLMISQAQAADAQEGIARFLTKRK